MEAAVGKRVSREGLSFAESWVLKLKGAVGKAKEGARVVVIPGVGQLPREFTKQVVRRIEIAIALVFKIGPPTPTTYVSGLEWGEALGYLLHKVC